MIKNSLKIILATLVLYSGVSQAWVVSSNATVSEIIQWHNNDEVYFKLSTGTTCYMPANEDKFYSLLLSLWASQKRADFHCWPETLTNQAITGHRVHRIIAK